MGATWKLRAIVYGSLLAIGALVLVARPGGDSSPKPKPLRTLRGTTSQGSEVAIGMDGRHVRVMSISHIDTPCMRSYSWQPTVGHGVAYRERGASIEVRERWPQTGFDFRMRAKLYNAGHNIDGTVAVSRAQCGAGTVRFSASG